MGQRCLVGAAVVIGALGAQSGPGASSGPDVELGRYLATECVTCHRKAVQTAAMTGSGGAIPNIYGINEATFTQVVKAYRARELPNVVMQTVTARLKDDEIAALAAFFARTKP